MNFFEKNNYKLWGGRKFMLVDSNLPVERDRLKNRLIRLVKEDDEILGCFFGGSIGNHTEDFYSDIDARIVVKKGINVERKQVEVIRSIGEYLFIEEMTNNYSVIHYATFIKLDLFVYTEEMLVPNMWLKDIQIVKDFGILEELSEKSQTIQYRVTQEEFDKLINHYYADYFELYRCWRRKEYNYIEALALSIKHSLISLWYISKGFVPNERQDWGKYEGEKTKLSHLESNFILSYTPFDLNQLETFTKKMEILVFESAEKVANYNNLFFSIDTFKKVHKRISFKKEELEIEIEETE